MKSVRDLRYILFVNKPFLRYGKLFVLITFLPVSTVMPLSSLLTVILPEKAIYIVVAQESTRYIRNAV
jgi:hypothetical protein